ncbi:ATP-binding cassette domain-containing protein [Actinotalea sp.]|uniref:ABC transporter ATP-binding protein n=1 Tax=Actinotalea sp. TaxID=1872145 RepID=UPI003562B97B
MDPVILVDGLTKSYGSFRALRGLDLEVRPGEVHAFLGPNGAGKSTTIRILLGLLRADGGRVQVLGHDPWRDVVALHRRLAYVPGDVSLWPSLTGGEAIDLLGTLRGGLDETRRAELIERFELDPTKRGRQYSKGNKQKVALVAALASDVELLLLDEPTSGLDPLMEEVFCAEIAEQKAQGRTILLSSHILSEAEALADRISIIRDGRIVESGTLDEMRRHTRTSIRAVLAEPPADLAGLVPVQDGHLDGDVLTVAVERTQVNDAMATLSHFGITELTVAPPSLSDLFLRAYGEESAPGPDDERAAPTRRRAAHRRRG